MTTTTGVDATSAIANQQAANAAAAAAAANGGTTPKTTTDSDALSANYTTFIKLLTTQLQNQDPLQPTDTSQFTQQLVEYSQVEQQIDTNSKLDTLVSAATKVDVGQYVNYVGKDVAVSGTQLALSDSSASLSYTLPTVASNVEIDITDSTGKTVATVTGDTTVGDHSVAWDGKGTDGSTLADGTYGFTVNATDATGAAITGVSQYFVSPVQAVLSTGNGTAVQLQLNGDLKVDPSTVTAIGS